MGVAVTRPHNLLPGPSPLLGRLSERRGHCVQWRIVGAGTRTQNGRQAQSRGPPEVLGPGARCGQRAWSGHSTAGYMGALTLTPTGQEWPPPCIPPTQGVT